MAESYHLNPFSGEPRLCHAQQRACPWGSPLEHFPTEEKARAFFEFASRGQLFETLSAERPIPPPPRPRPGRPWLSSKEMEAINLDGVACGQCGKRPNPFQAAHIMNEQNEYKCACGSTQDIYTMKIQVGKTKDTFAALDVRGVYELTWTHGTTSGTWEDHMAAGFYAHLGSEQAAIDRHLAETFRPEGPVKAIWLYDLKVRPESTVDEGIIPDGNEDWSTMNHPEDNPLGSDVQRYFNRWEDLASVSIVANTQKLEVVGKRRLTREEAWATPSLFNVRELAEELR